MLIDFPILTLIVFLPSLGAILAYASRSDRAARGVSFAISGIRCSWPGDGRTRTIAGSSPCLVAIRSSCPRCAGSRPPRALT